MKSLNVININNSPYEAQMHELYQLRDSHQIWDNPLLMSCESGLLRKEDYQYIFSQYYYLSKNFTRLISAAIVNCENEYFRAKLSENLWEEAGEEEIEHRHSVLFEKFLSDTLGLGDLNSVKSESYTELFFEKYLSQCSSKDTLCVAAMLSLGSEGIVSRLYKFFKKGLLSVGIKDESLLFFNLHIDCDDDHAEVLEQLMLSFCHEEGWYERCARSVKYILNIRDEFFYNIFNGLKSRRVLNIFGKIESKAKIKENKKRIYQSKEIHENKYLLYENDLDESKINFKVNRIPVQGSLLDPRLARIPVGKMNEKHAHAHETVFYIVSGLGEVVIDGYKNAVSEGDVVHIPRWTLHQTHNIGDADLIYFAVTDHGLTRHFIKNADQCYRLNKE